MSKVKIDATLPFPPIAPRYFRLDPLRQIRFASLEGRTFQKAVAEKLAGVKPIEGNLALHVSFYHKDSPSRIIDTYLEPLKDALIHAGVMHDELQLKVLYVHMHEPDGNPRTEVHIEELD